ncbi:hypothetical protein ABK040_003319 [Willaertia magna]
MGINSARKLKNNSKKKKNKNQTKSNQKKPSHLSGIVKEELIINANSPNYGRKYCVKVTDINTGKDIIVKVTGNNSLRFININDKMLVERKRKIFSDIPNCKFKCVTNTGKNLKHLSKEIIKKGNNCHKYDYFLHTRHKPFGTNLKTIQTTTNFKMNKLSI